MCVYTCLAQVKQRRAWLVPGWVTACDYRMSCLHFFVDRHHSVHYLVWLSLYFGVSQGNRWIVFTPAWVLISCSAVVKWSKSLIGDLRVAHSRRGRGQLRLRHLWPYLSYYTCYRLNFCVSHRVFRITGSNETIIFPYDVKWNFDVKTHLGPYGHF